MTELSAARENRLLAQLPDRSLEALLQVAELAPFRGRTYVQHNGEPVRTVHFPLSGMLSMISVDETGSAVEVATVGREGMSGVTAILGVPPLPFDVMWQIPGRSLAVEPIALKTALDGEPLFSDLAVRSLVALLAQAGQNAGCNRLHDIDQRAAKWLLLCLDRVDEDSFDLTQEFFAIMLGVTRPRLNLVQATFARAGFIRYSRGRLTVLDRPALEDQACGCYAVIAGKLAELETRD